VRAKRGVLIGGVICLAATVAADPEHIRIEVGQPTLWTLEQAHYQLARQRQKNAGLETQWPSADKLDANAIHGSRLDQLRTLFSASVGFDAVAGATNTAVLERHETDTARRALLTGRLDELRDRSLQLTEQVSVKTLEVAALHPERDADLIRQRRAEIEAINVVKAEVNTQIASTDKELAATAATLGVLAKPEGPTPVTTLPDTAIKSIIDSKEILTRDPKLHASTVLDNFIQMQYELIVKQLALLRDDVGAENRLVFVELPVSIYTADSSKAEGLIVRTEYRIAGLRACRSLDAYLGDQAFNKLVPDSESQGIPRAAAAIINRPPSEEYKAALSTCFPDLAAAIEDASKQTIQVLDRAPLSLAYIAETPQEAAFPEVLEYMKVEPPQPEADSRTATGATPAAARTTPARRINPHVVDLIPRQSALNVNDVHDRISGIRLGAALTWLTGLGAKSSYERQREKFEQFVHQDVFAAGHGKGTQSFGWTFGPNPGQKRLAPGVRNTFAALVIPRRAVGIDLTMQACSYERKTLPPVECGRSTAVSLKVPADQEGFFVREVRYSTAPVGQMATVFLYGPHFSPQITVLVNGVPLFRKIDLARDFALSASTTVPQGIQGDFEYVNQGLVVLRFAMGPDFAGTPKIALVTPQKAAEINRFNLQVNGKPFKLDDCGRTAAACAPMFSSLTLRELRIVSVRANAADPTKTDVRAHLLGTGFTQGDSVTVNGNPATINMPADAPPFHDISFDAPTADDWTVTLAQGSARVRLALKNPLAFKKGSSTALFVDASGGQPPKAIVTLAGGPFDAAVDKVFIGATEIKEVLFSTGEISFEVRSPADSFAVSVRRAGSRTGATWTIAKPAKPKS
jgi:hypothetical protein